MLTIHNLTKEELLYLIEYKCLCHYFNEDDLIWVRYEIMTKKGCAMMDKTMIEMKRYTGNYKNIPEYLKASDEWEKGMKLCDEANKFLDTNQRKVK